MYYQLTYLSRIKNLLIRQFYVKGTSGKMIDGLSDEDYSFFLEHTRMPGMLELLGELKLYCLNGHGAPVFDVPTIEKLVVEMNNRFTSMQLKMDNIESIYTNLPALDYKTYIPKTNKELITLLAELQGNVKYKKKAGGAKQVRVSRKEKELTKKKAFKVKMERIAAKLKFFKVELEATNKFVSLDFEAFERNQKKITEVGFSVYENGECKNYHYIVKENIAYLNGSFVADNKFNFAFGKSEILPLKEALSRLSKVLVSTDYLVGHAVGNELKWLRKNNVELLPDIKTIDTSILAGGFMKIGQRVSLTRILTYLGIKHNFLHNAGNDSVYTMKALCHMTDAGVDIS